MTDIRKHYKITGPHWDEELSHNVIPRIIVAFYRVLVTEIFGGRPILTGIILVVPPILGSILGATVPSHIVLLAVTLAGAFSLIRIPTHKRLVKHKHGHIITLLGTIRDPDPNGAFEAADGTWVTGQQVRDILARFGPAPLGTDRFLERLDTLRVRAYFLESCAYYSAYVTAPVMFVLAASAFGLEFAGVPWTVWGYIIGFAGTVFGLWLTGAVMAELWRWRLRTERDPELPPIWVPDDDGPFGGSAR